MQLKVETRTPKEGVAVIDLEGEVDVYTSPRLKQEMVDLLNRGLVNLIVDLAYMALNPRVRISA